MDDYADLELSLRRGAGDAYALSMRLSQPGSDADTRVGPANDLPVSFDLSALQAAAADPAEYGRLLSSSLFADKNVLAGFQQARATAQATSSPLRLRLLIAPDAPELHSIYWETLRDPADMALTLFTGERVLFSRHIASGDLGQVTLRPRGELKALAAIANPSNLSEYGLVPLAVDEELRGARTGLVELPVTALVASGEQHCTLDAILDQLRNGYDILYLVAHGIFLKGQGWLVLEGTDGKVERVSGEEFASRIMDMQSKPRLIMLVSCQSAGKGTGQALQALGPRLAEAGVPAVIAMQGSISMGTVSRFMPVFFKELQKDGGLDRAVSVARGAVRKEPDFWMPVLFMRLKSGRIWTEEAGTVPAEENAVTVHYHGDTYNVSNIQNSNVNVGSTLSNVSQKVDHIPGVDQPAREELQRLVQQLDLGLQKASGNNIEAARAVSELARDLVENLSKDEPNKARIKIILGGLKQAAEITGKGLPDIPPIASQLISHVSRIFGLSNS